MPFIKDSKSSKFLFLFATIFLLSSCGGGNSVKEPQEFIDGYLLESRLELFWDSPFRPAQKRLKPINPDGTYPYKDKMISIGGGEKFNASRINFQYPKTHPAVNGFYYVEGGKGEDLVGKEIKDEQMVIYGPFDDAGHFYYDVAPVSRENEGITYIRKDGTVAFDLNDAVGEMTSSAMDFEGGLSIFILEHKYASGAVDTEGKVAIEPKYDRLWYIGSELWAGLNGETWEILNKKGEVMFTCPKHDCTFDYRRNIMENYAFSGDYGLLVRDSWANEWKIVDKTGKVLLTNGDVVEVDEENNDSITWSPTRVHHNGHFVFQRDRDRYGSHKQGARVVNIKGEFESDSTYQYIMWLNDDYMIAKAKYRDGVFKGDELIMECGDELPIPLNNGYFAIYGHDESYGPVCRIYDKDGDEILEEVVYDRNALVYDYLIHRLDKTVYTGTKNNDYPRMTEVPRSIFFE